MSLKKNIPKNVSDFVSLIWNVEFSVTMLISWWVILSQLFEVLNLMFQC